ncbi:MAG: archaeosortase/exosortase family protein [Dysgonamonadaceae bacterium]|jgi:exosortase family protein XrtF|nr:archaeosortase/exosortase family protein [Dysgonamonadaceae bacterium]
MKKDITKAILQLKPYQSIIYFLLMFFGAHFLWKWVVDGDLHSQQIAIFGVDYTAQFYEISKFTTRIIYWFSCLFPNTDDLFMRDTRLWFYNGHITLSIIWGCTGIKQLYSFLLLMLFYPGPWRKKLWYLPMGSAVLFFYNIVRISAILFLTYRHPERFDSLHEGVFRYIYYGLIFLLWVIWEEAVRKKQETGKDVLSNQSDQ